MGNNTDNTLVAPEPEEEMVRIGARIPESVWRKVKANAMLNGETAEARVARILQEHESKTTQKRGA